MLVKDPNQRYTIEQIKKHKWMQADPAVKTILSYNAEANFEGDKILDEYNEQALELMQGLGIDIERTKTALVENAYDHHTAIYYLLVDRLRQHRSSYPLQTQLETRLRRPSGIAEAAVVRGGRANAMVVPNRAVQRTVPAQPPRPYIPLQYAINELHERIPTPPEIRREIATECVKELSPVREPGLKARSISPRQMIGPALSLDNGVCRETDSPAVERMESEDTEEEKPKVRRHTVHSMPKQPLVVPPYHPLRLARGNSEEVLEDSNVPTFQVQPAIVVSHCAPNNSLVTSTPPLMSHRGSGQHLHEPTRTNFHTPLARRASDGNAVTLAFHQHLRVSTAHNRIKQLQQEHQKLQELYQKSLSPAELSDQQAVHSEYKLKYEQMREELQKHYEELMAVNEQEQNRVRMEPLGEQQTGLKPDQQAPYPLSLHHQLQQLHIDARHNPLRRTPSYKQNPHKQVFRTSSYKRAQICGMLPPLESESPTDILENTEPLVPEDTTNIGRYSIISL